MKCLRLGMAVKEETKREETSCSEQREVRDAIAMSKLKNT
jgi:hypothetical protein